MGIPLKREVECIVVSANEGRRGTSRLKLNGEERKPGNNSKHSKAGHTQSWRGIGLVRVNGGNRSHRSGAI